jgi:hypothetical protein
MKSSLLIVAILLSGVAASAQQIPPGTTLPVELNSTLDARHVRPGQKITGILRQDVVLPDGNKIPERTQVAGHVISATTASSGLPSTLTIAFDQVLLKGRPVAVTTHLRALASMNDVFEAKMPTNSWDDYGTSPSDWNTIQVGGAGVYRGNGQVVSDGEVVGRSTDYGAVTAKLTVQRGSACHSDEREQALWIFSPWACGVYGINDLKIANLGYAEPVGEIQLQSPRDVHVSGGSGWLLRVESQPSP